MHSFAAAGAGFLLAVLWFDLMFDAQTRRHNGEVLPPRVLASISAYYRRVTTDAWPMNRLIAAVMLLTRAAIVVEIVQAENAWWIGLGSLPVGGRRFRAYDDPDRAERASVGKLQGYGGGAVAIGARGVPRSHVQLRAHELRLILQLIAR
jgi:hypothetical protein